MAIIDPKQKENLPLLSEVMQIDWRNEQEVQKFINLKIGINEPNANWWLQSEYYLRYGWNPAMNGMGFFRYVSLYGDPIADYYAPPVFNSMQESWGSRLYVQKFIEFTQKIVTDIFETGFVEYRLLWSLKEWGEFVGSLRIVQQEIPVKRNRHLLRPHYAEYSEKIDAFQASGQMLYVGNEPDWARLQGCDPDYKVPIQDIGEDPEAPRQDGSQEKTTVLMRDLYSSLTNLYEKEQYKNLRRCIQCENIFLSNPIKRGQNEPKYCSDTCGSIYRTYKSRGKISAK